MSGVVIDDNYWHDKLVLGDYQVENMKNIGLEKKINLIVGFDEALDLVQERIPKKVPVNKIYYLDPSMVKRSIEYGV